MNDRPSTTRRSFTMLCLACPLQNRKQKKIKKPCTKSGFSLIEVVMALGIISFALLAIVGLLCVGLNSNKESTEDTNLAICTQTALALIRSRGFSAVNTDAAYIESSTTPSLYFDATGKLLTDSSGAPGTPLPPTGHYACTITHRTPPSTPATSNFLILQLKFDWPLAAPVAHRQQRIVVTSLANYE